MRFLVMFVTAVCVLFLIKLRWPKEKNFYDTVYMRYGQETLKTFAFFEKLRTTFWEISSNLWKTLPFDKNFLTVSIVLVFTLK